MTESAEIEIIRECSKDNPFIVLYKPPGLPSAPLKSGDDSALTRILALNQSLSKVRGKKAIECGLLHRLDTLSSGLLLIATTQDAYNELEHSQEAGLFVKGYSVQCQRAEKGEVISGYPPLQAECEILPDSIKKYTVKSAFRYYGRGRREVRPVTGSSGPSALKKSELHEYTTRIFLDEKLSARCYINRGFRHQVRCHLSWLGYPALGDPLYNPLYRAGDTLRFFADYLRFPHPLTGECVEVSIRAE